MSINNSHYGQNAVLLYNGEIILIYYDGVEISFDPEQSVPILKGNKKGRIYLTSHRVVFINKSQNDVFQSFSMPFMSLRGLDIEQPVFGANFIKGECKAEPQGRWEGTAKFKLWFNNGGAIEFGQCLLNAGRLASEARQAQQYFAPAQTTHGSSIYPAPPPAYNTLNPNSYGWVPTSRFPERPQGEDVFMYDSPPPYSGIFPQQKQNEFDVRQRVSHGYVNPNDPSKVYVAASAPANDEVPPPSYNDSKKKE
jgi:hypothetical protein